MFLHFFLDSFSHTPYLKCAYINLLWEVIIYTANYSVEKGIIDVINTGHWEINPSSMFYHAGLVLSCFGQPPVLKRAKHHELVTAMASKRTGIHSCFGLRARSEGKCLWKQGQADSDLFWHFFLFRKYLPPPHHTQGWWTTGANTLVCSHDLLNPLKQKKIRHRSAADLSEISSVLR